MRAEVASTKRAKGTGIAHKRNHVGVTIVIDTELFDKLKASALKNCRSLTGECKYWVTKGLTEPES